MGLRRTEYRVPVCPECGCDEVEPGPSLINPLEDGVKCHNCGYEYELRMEHSKVITKEEYEELTKMPGMFGHYESSDEYKERIHGPD